MKNFDFSSSLLKQNTKRETKGKKKIEGAFNFRCCGFICGSKEFE